MAKPGDQLDIYIQAVDGNEELYPLAIVRDQDGIALAGSPVILPHVGQGLYKDTGSFTFPAAASSVTAVVEMYIDAGLTNISRANGNGLNLYERDYDQDILDCLTEIKDLLQIILQKSIHAQLAGDVSSNAIIGIIEATKIQGIVEKIDDLTGQLSNDTIDGMALDASIDGEVDC